MTEKHIDQSGQSVERNQFNVAGDATVGQVGDNIDTGGGDYIARDKIINTYIETKTIVSVESLHEIEDLDPTPGKPPFKGLAYFTEKDKDIYFGREALSDKLVERLRKSRFLAVIGASGSGKSSLLRAGIIPRLRQRNWAIHIIKPGAHPVTALASSLTQDELDPSSADNIAAALLDRPDILLKVGDKLAARADAERLLLVVDQFEELFTQCKDEGEQNAFVDNLVSVAQAGSATAVMLSMRADFYERVSDFPKLTDLVSQQQEYVKQMAQEDLVRVIAEPARLGGWQFVEGLVEQFVVDVGREPGRLPLLSHALLETWERRRGTVMTLGGYRDAGGVEGAIAQTAEETLDRLIAENPDFENVTREVFLDLTELGEGTEDTRRIASRADLQAGAASGDLDTVLEELVAARLITMREGEVEVAHEALIRRWPTLREWLEDNRERLRFERQLQRDAQVWANLDRDDGALYRGAQLARAAELVDSGEVKLTELPAEFLLVSRALAQREEREREEQRQRELENAQKLAAVALAREEAEIEARNAAEAQREAEELARQRAEADAADLRRRAVFLAGALIIAATLAVAAVIFFGNARTSAQEAEDNLAQATRALIAEATAQVDAQINLQQAQTAEAGALENEALAITKEADAASAQAKAEAEAIRAIAAEGTAEAGRAEVVDLLTAIQASQFAEASSAELQENQELALMLATIGLGLRSQSDTVASFYESTIFSPYRHSLYGHDGGVMSASFSPDGQRIVTASDDFSAKVWDVAGNEEVSLEGHEGVVLSASFSPDGQRIVTASSDGSAKVWDVAGNEEVSLEGHEGVVLSASFSPDGQRIVTASDDFSAKVWDVAGNEEASLEGHTARVRSASFSPDGQRIVTASDDFSAKVWDVAGNEEASLEGHTDWVRSASFSPDGQRIVTASDDFSAKVWDLAGNEEASLEGHEGVVLSASFSPDGQRIVTASEDGSAKVWSIYPSLQSKETVARERIFRGFSDSECRRFFRADLVSCPRTVEEIFAFFDEE